MKTHKYQLTIEFESEKPVRPVNGALIQSENGLTYFTEGDINNTFVYGTGKARLKKLGTKKIRK